MSLIVFARFLDLAVQCISWNFYVMYVVFEYMYMYSKYCICVCGTGSRFHNSRAGQILITLKHWYSIFPSYFADNIFHDMCHCICHISCNFISFSSTFPIYKTTVLFLSVFTFFIKFSIIIVWYFILYYISPLNHPFILLVCSFQCFSHNTFTTMFNKNFHYTINTIYNNNFSFVFFFKSF